MVETATVLLVEDNVDDAFMFKRAVRKSGRDFHVHVAGNGQEAIDYMSGVGPYADRQKFPLPKIIITDNKMPVMSGSEFLKWLGQNPGFKVIPTIVLGGGDTKENVEKAYRLGVQSYFFKPGEAHELTEVVRKIFEYWDKCMVP